MMAYGLEREQAGPRQARWSHVPGAPAGLPMAGRVDSSLARRVVEERVGEALK